MYFVVTCDGSDSVTADNSMTHREGRIITVAFILGNPNPNLLTIENVPRHLFLMIQYV